MGQVRDELMQLVNEEIEAVVEEWKDLLKISDSLVCVHTLGVILCAVRDEEFKKMNKRH